MAILKKPAPKYRPGDKVTAKVINDTIETVIDANEKAAEAAANLLQVGSAWAGGLTYGSEPALSAEITREENHNLLNLQAGIPKGKRGARISTGDEFPTEDVLHGDLFIEKGTYDLCENDNGVWERVDNLKGAAGNVDMYKDPDCDGLKFKFAEQDINLTDLEREMLINRDEISLKFKNDNEQTGTHETEQISLNQEEVSFTYEKNGAGKEMLLNHDGIVLRCSRDGYYDGYYNNDLVIDSDGIRFNGMSFEQIIHIPSLRFELEEIKGRLNQLEGM